MLNGKLGLTDYAIMINMIIAIKTIVASSTKLTVLSGSLMIFPRHAQ